MDTGRVEAQTGGELIVNRATLSWCTGQPKDNNKSKFSFPNTQERKKHKTPHTNRCLTT